MWRFQQAKEDDYNNLRLPAIPGKRLCEDNKLSIRMLQPFPSFEGWPPNPTERENALQRAVDWISIMEALGTDMLQVGSSDSEDITSDCEFLASA
jgi:sugar phosphate isomerase/epimerase